MKNNTMVSHQIVLDLYLSLETEHQTDRSTILANTYHEAISQR